MRILELTNYSAGGCGVFARVKKESSLLKKRGHEVKIFSSYFEKGTNKIIASNDIFEGVKIRRFKGKKIGGESFINWFGEEAIKEAVDFNPNVIIAHSYRHPHTINALKLKSKLGCKVFLVTHAPFNRSKTRSIISNLIVKTMDWSLGKKILNKYDKIIAIANWEIPYLLRIGAARSKIEIIPNGVDDTFFKKSNTSEKNKIIYTGRVSPIKSLETALFSFMHIKNKEVTLEIFGPAEPNYLLKLNKLAEKLGINNKIIWNIKKYNPLEQIKHIDSAKIFILPSISEGLPQVLIEAMARKKIVIASDNPGAKEIVKDGKNGFIFKIGDARELARKIDLVLGKENKKMKNEALKSANIYRWTNIINKIEKILN